MKSYKILPNARHLPIRVRGCAVVLWVFGSRKCWNLMITGVPSLFGSGVAENLMKPCVFWLFLKRIKKAGGLLLNNDFLRWKPYKTLCLLTFGRFWGGSRPRRQTNTQTNTQTPHRALPPCPSRPGTAYSVQGDPPSLWFAKNQH